MAANRSRTALSTLIVVVDIPLSILLKDTLGASTVVCSASQTMTKSWSRPERPWGDKELWAAYRQGGPIAERLIAWLVTKGDRRA